MVARQRSCYDQALELLSRRAHFRAELATKLKARAYPAEEIASALERLSEKRLLDDREVAANFVAQRSARLPVGRNRLHAELVRRGVAPEIIGEVLAGFGPELEQAQAAVAARRRLGRGKLKAQTLARHLAYRGFTGPTIFGALRQAQGAGQLADFDSDLDALDSIADVAAVEE